MEYINLLLNGSGDTEETSQAPETTKISEESTADTTKNPDETTQNPEEDSTGSSGALVATAIAFSSVLHLF